MHHVPDEPIPLTCPGCGALLQAPPSARGRMLPCPKCKTPVEVASPNDKAEEDVEQGYAIAGLNRVADESAMQSLEQEERLPRGIRAGEIHSQRPKLPRHPMVTDLFAFLTQLGAVIWISALILGAVVMLGALLLAIGLSFIPSPGTWIGSMVLSGCSGVITLIWLVVASAFYLCILQESASGNRKIESWPEVVWIDWIGDSLYVFMSLLGAGAIGYGIAWLSGGMEAWSGIIFPLCAYVFFPLLLLSTLEQQSPFSPASGAALRSLWISWKAWVVFYLETGVLGALFAGFAALAVLITTHVGPGAAAMVGCLSLCAVSAMMVLAQVVYFRLLGRLAWVCAEQMRARDEVEEDFVDGDEEDSAPKIHPTPVDDF